jgi:putative pyruvate formate lyase activating enzyme
MGLRLPLVYNIVAYDTIKSMQMMEGIVDIYMPDVKYWSKTKRAIAKILEVKIILKRLVPL